MSERAIRNDSGQSLTAGDVVERIQEHVGIPWRSQTVDTFKAGSPDTVVTGISADPTASFRDWPRLSVGAPTNPVTTGSSTRVPRR
jgi:hypothetical protein